MPASILRLRAFGEEYERVLADEPPPIGYLAPDGDFHELVIRLLRYVR